MTTTYYMLLFTLAIVSMSYYIGRATSAHSSSASHKWSVGIIVTALLAIMDAALLITDPI